MSRLLLLALTVVAATLHLSPVQSATVSPAATAAPGEVAGPPVTVAVGNAHEGAVVLDRFDRRNGADRTAFARRVLGRPSPVPDIVLVQEVRGMAHTVAATLSRHPRAQRGDARYVVAVSPTHGRAARTLRRGQDREVHRPARLRDPGQRHDGARRA